MARHLAASRSHLIPPEHIVTGNLRCNGPHPAESAASTFASQPMLLGDLNQIAPADRDTLRSLFSWFRKQRTANDFACYSVNLLEKNTSAPTLWHWSGFLRTGLDGNGILGIFQNHSPNISATVPVMLPPGVDDHAVVTLTDALTGQTEHCTASELRSGHHFKLSGPHSFRLASIQCRRGH